MTELEFKALAAQGYNRIPVIAESFADLETPLSLYLKLANEPNTFLLESVVGGERFGRYSFIGLAARRALRSFIRDDGCTTELLEGGRVLVVDADSNLVERKLKTGLANWEYTEVVEGLAQGDRVVTSLDRTGVKAGARVTLESKSAQ